MLSSVRSVILHLRVPFSWFLLPVWLATVCISPNFSGDRLGLTFLILHFLLYPASNGFNSYFDRDTGPIGGLRNPPPVNTGLYYVTLLLDIAAIVLAWRISLLFAVMITGFSLASRAYSHPSVRVKRFPVTGLLYTSFFQGLYTVAMVYVGLNDFPLSSVFREKVLVAGIGSSLLLMAVYPLTQVYQHEEDARRGDRTFSLLVGINGTFLFSAATFLVASAVWAWFIPRWLVPVPITDFLLALSPALVYFLWWFSRVRKDQSAANWRSLMTLNLLSSTGLNVFFFNAFLEVTNVAQVLGLG